MSKEQKQFSDPSPQGGEDGAVKELENLKEVNERQAEEQTKAERREPPDETPGFLANADDPLKRDRSACADALLPTKTQGVKPSRDNGVGVLQTAAKKAAASNSRSDVQEYMRLRRNFV